MRSATKKVLLTLLAGLPTLIGASLVLAAIGFRPPSMKIAAFFAAIVVLAGHIATISGRVSLVRSISTAVPLLCYVVAILLCFFGWGDPFEHLVRGFLHSIHRVVPQEWIGGIISVLAAFIPLLFAGLVWLSISLVTRTFRFQVLLGISAASLLLVGLGLGIVSVFSLVNEAWADGIVRSLLAISLWGLAALAFRLLNSKARRPHVLAFSVGTLLLFPLAGGITLLESSSEKCLPEAQPIRTVDVDKSGSLMDASKGWAVFPVVDEMGASWAAQEGQTKASEATLPRRPLHFKAESNHRGETRVLFDDGGKGRLLARYNCDPVSLDQLSEDRILVTACKRFSVFDAQGNLVGSDDFVRPEVRFAALSLDGRRFALLVYVWGFGDPAYVEEEEIVVYDTATARPILAVKSDPRSQSRAGLSPDGSMLAIRTVHTLSLFQLPALEKISTHN